MGSLVGWKIHEKKSCVRVSLINIYIASRVSGVGLEYCRGCLKETLQMVSR